MKRVLMLALATAFLCAGCDDKPNSTVPNNTPEPTPAAHQETKSTTHAVSPEQDAWVVDYSNLPERTKTYIPMLEREVKKWWPEMKEPSVFCGLIEQETCYSLTHKYCWSPTATLKTSREEGRGLGQITRAWDAKGNLRFDALKEVRDKHREALDGWSWKNVGDALFQIRGLIFEFKDAYALFSYAKTETDRLAFADSAYNGGAGGVAQDRALCKKVKGCDPNVWMGNVADHSRKAKTKAKGYGQSFYEINRNHVKQVVYGRKQGYEKTRRARYQKAGLK